MKCSKIFLPLVAIPMALALTACGGSDDDETSYSESYIQFYNGSPNSAITYLSVDDSTLSGSSYGDATTVYTYEPDELEVDLSRVDSDGQSIELKTETVTLKKGVKKLIMLTGDYQEVNTVSFDIERQDYEDQFDLFATSMIEDAAGYDLYMAESGTPFTSSHLVASTQYQVLEHGTYWDTDADSDYFDEDEYVFYITEAGSDEVLFQSSPINMSYSTEYVAIIRQGSGPTGSNLVLDLMNNSTTVSSYTDIQASSQFRVYNSIDDKPDLSVTLSGNEDEHQLSVDVDSISDFQVVDYGDYRLSAQDDSGTLLSNKLVTLNQGDSKTIILFDNAQGKMTSIAFDESTLPQIYDHYLNVSNLVPDFSDVDIYFVRQDETIETAQYKIKNIQFAENDTISLPNGFYEIVAVYEQSSEDSTLLYRSTLLDISEEANFIVTLEPDQNSPTGYTVNLLK
ncbi:DUF4397 domain-containing protein [Neptunicella sp. SCSIO 80796]|uniref:DUF4397 domain-containing protein n=1 Tax=Neptunicella plasticusilytica TaxID=3117012 RepID=UPI003A4D8CA7